MCRLLLTASRDGVSPVDVDAVLAAAARMSLGSADHEKPEMRHVDGWGCACLDRDGDHGLAVHRSTLSIRESAAELGRICSPVLGLHIRDATVPTTRGLEFTHPISRGAWHLMHNGFLPQMEAHIGRACSFDTSAYLRYVVGDHLDDGTGLGAGALVERLRRMPSGGTSANAVLFHAAGAAVRVFVIHWFPEDSNSPDFYTLRLARTDGAITVASEVCPELAPCSCWAPVPPRSVLELRITDRNIEEIWRS